MSRWYAVIKRFECRECGKEVSDVVLSCPHCGWTDKKQQQFDKRNHEHCQD